MNRPVAGTDTVLVGSAAGTLADCGVGSVADIRHNGQSISDASDALPLGDWTSAFTAPEPEQTSSMPRG